MDRVYASLEEFIGQHPEEFKAVKGILAEYWTPAIPGAHPGPGLSVDDFVPQVVFLGLDQSSLVHITDFLAESEAELLGLPESTPQQWLRCKKAAEAVIEYFEARQQQGPA